jgi:hypothetical protein
LTKEKSSDIIYQYTAEYAVSSSLFFKRANVQKEVYLKMEKLTSKKLRNTLKKMVFRK